MATLPTTTFFWRPAGAAADAWTEAPTGGFTPVPGARVEVVSVGPSRARAIIADLAPSVIAPIAGQSFDPGVSGVFDVSGAFGGTNLRFALGGAPAWATINPATGVVSYAAPMTAGATGSWTVTASNSAGTAVQTGFDTAIGPIPPKTVVWALIGQSNMVGRAAYDGLGGHPAGTLQWGRVAGVDGTLIAATHPLQHWDPSSTNIGPDIGFADAWTAANPDDTLVFMPGADGGTGFSDAQWRVGDPLYVDAVARINALFAANPGFEFGGFLWHQGEKDTGQTAAFYQTHLDAMIAGLRSEVTVAGPTTPFVLGQMVESYYVGTAGREAIQAVTDDTPNRVAYTAVASSAGLTDKGDALHFNAASQRTLGARYHAAALAAAINAPIAPAAPGQVTGAIALAGDGQVTLGWTAPAPGGSAITDYVIERQIGGGAFSVIADGVGTGVGFVDAGLTNDLVHGYRVSAVSAAGTGAASAVTTATPIVALSSPAAVTVFDAASDPNNGASYTFTGLAIGSGTVFVGVTRRGSASANVTVTALTISGAATTQIGEQRHPTETGQAHSMHRFDGASAGTVDVTVTLAGSASRCGIVVWTVENAGMTTFTGNSQAAGPNITLTIDAPADGVLLAHGMSIASAPGLSFSDGVDQRLAERLVDASYYDQAGDRAYPTAQAGVSVAQIGTNGANTILSALAVHPA
jgi:hypothetical protein